MKDLELSHELEDRLETLNDWASYNYHTHVIGGRVYGRVDHFKNYQMQTRSKGVEPLKDFREKFTYAYPNHFPQHSLNGILLKSLMDQNNRPLFSHEYLSH